MRAAGNDRVTGGVMAGLDKEQCDALINSVTLHIMIV